MGQTYYLQRPIRWDPLLLVTWRPSVNFHFQELLPLASLNHIDVSLLGYSFSVWKSSWNVHHWKRLHTVGDLIHRRMFELHVRQERSCTRKTCCALKATHFSSTRTIIKDKNIWIINWWWKLTIGSSFWLWNTLKVPMLFLRNDSFTSQNGDLNDCLAFVFPGCKHRGYVMGMNSWIIGDFKI